jgi:hypothetical protein
LNAFQKRLNAICTLFKCVQTESCIVQGHATFVSSKQLSIAFHTLIQLALSYRRPILKVFLSTEIKVAKLQSAGFDSKNGINGLFEPP